MIQVLAKVACGGDKIILDDIPSKLPQLTSYIFTILLIAVPLLLVILGTIDLYKGITANKEDEMTKSRKLFVKRLITGAIVFLVLGLTKFVISIIDNKTNSKGIINCVDCFISGTDKCNDNPIKESDNTAIEDTPIENSNTNTNTSTPSNNNNNNNPIVNGGSSGSSSGSSSSSHTNIIDDSGVINIDDTNVTNPTTNNQLINKDTGSLTNNYSGINYYLYVPVDATEGMPLVVFLHGIGEQNNMTALKNLKPVTTITDGTMSGLEKFIFLAPNATSKGNWHVSTTWDDVKALIDYIVDEYSVNPKRIYLTGFSAGGCGVWGLVNKYPYMFRAAVAVSCTPGSIETSNFRNTAIYAISGGAEDYRYGMQKTVDSINKAGGNAQFKIIPNAGHIATQNSYSTNELYRWLLSQ